jgi:hypothetical protein
VEYVRFVGPRGTCTVPLNEAEFLAAELRRMSLRVGDAAWGAAGMIDYAISGRETVAREISYEKIEGNAILATLERMIGDRPLSQSLLSLRDAFAIDRDVPS